MIEQAGVSIAKTQERLVTDDAQPKVPPLVDLSTHPLSFVERDDSEHYYPDSPTMPIVCCRLAEDQQEKSCGVYMKFLAEGAANVVFTIHPWTPEAPRKPLVFVASDSRATLYNTTTSQDKVLRISKGNHKTGSCEEIMEDFELKIRPLFDRTLAKLHGLNGQDTSAHHYPGPSAFLLESGCLDFSEHMMNHEPVLLERDVFEQLTDEIDENSSRKENLLIDIREQIGILLPDMTSKPGQSVTIEIKPKWLEQSPTASRDAYRCRTCALEASRTDTDKKSIYICPLQLLTGNATVIRPYVRLKVEKELAQFGVSRPGEAETNDIIDRITRYITTGKGKNLLMRLRDIQRLLDPKGVLWHGYVSDPGFDTNLALAMTLRDCSMFIKVDYSSLSQPTKHSDNDANTKHLVTDTDMDADTSTNTYTDSSADSFTDSSADADADADSDGIECKLGDLDVKAAAKLVDWVDKELILCRGGWYTRIDAGGVPEFPHEQCLIEQGWRKHVPHYF